MKFSFTQLFPNLIKKFLYAILFPVFLFLANGLNGQNCPSPEVGFIFINQVMDSSAVVNWTDVSEADSYIVEYGPEGFTPGGGLTETTIISGITLDSLNPCVSYQLYIYSVCGNNLSAPAGPEFFLTECPNTCTYTFQLFDEESDSWDGAFLTVSYLGEELIYTLTDSDMGEATFELEVISSVPICVNYSPGLFEDENSFNILDPDGNIIYSNGPDPVPVTGDIFDFIGCDSSCQAPKNWRMADVNADNATTAWELPFNFDGSVFLEYGPLGFIRGTGTTVTTAVGQNSFTITGLDEKTWYNVYLGVDCGMDSSEVIGPLTFQTLWFNDVGVTTISPNADDFCNLGIGDTIEIGLTNFGQTPQTLFNFFYSVNGVPANIPTPMDGLFTGVVGNDSTQIIQFETTYDFLQPGPVVIEAWTEFEDDSDLSNDTFRVEFLNSFPKPVMEDFEDLAIADTWTTDAPDPFLFGAGEHNNPTAVFGVNLWNSNREMNLNTGRIGPVFAVDTFYFDYRFVDWGFPTDSIILSGGDSLIVQISDDCEETYETVLVIDSTNHIPTTDFTRQTILLNAYDGLTLHIRFIGKWGAGDYWLDLDNINITGCPVSFGPIIDIQGAFANGNNGIATFSPIGGTAPYTFEWSTNETTEGDIGILEGLPTGAYFVDITDANGCMETFTFEVGTILVSADEEYGVEAMTLYPNPSTGLVNLDIELTTTMNVQMKVMDLSGRIITQANYDNTISQKEQFDLSNQPAGLYIIQVVADGKPYYAKLMIAR
ncbi:MAG: T9SS type A sorting domain-containing protein [Bacteroidota bacterium]